MVAHTVDCQAPGLGRSINHVASGAHAEGIYAPPAGKILRQLIGGRRQGAVVFHSILEFVNHSLRMLHPNAYGKRFGFHGNLVLKQHGEGIPGAVPNGKYGNLRLKGIFFSSCMIIDLQGRKTAALPSGF